MRSKHPTDSRRDSRNFLKGHTSYDVFPVSFRIIVLDNKLEIKKALHVLLANCGLPCAVMAYALDIDLNARYLQL